MKLTALFIFVSIACFAQKKEIKKDSLQYHRFVKIEIQDLQALINTAQEYKRVLMYDPTIPEDKKSATFRNIELALIELQKRISIDSVKIKLK